MLEAMSGAGHFADRLAAAVERKGAPLCVGLDPMPDRLPGELRGPDLAASYELFCRGIIDAVAEIAVAVKPQSAFFEALGSRGVAVFERVCEHARDTGLLVIADAKRGDIASTAEAYAEAFAAIADAVTVNPYLGEDSLEPFFAHDGLGVFPIVKTSNPGSGDLQDLPLADGRPFWQHVAERVNAWGADRVGASGLSSVGAVVGATHPDVLGEARALMPRAVLLLPGIGAQGGRPEELAAAFAAGPASALPSASRSVIYADSGPRWQEAAGAAAAELAEQLRALVPA